MSQQNDVINPTTTTSTVINHHNNRLQSDIINTNQKTVSPAPPSLPSQTTTTTVTNSNIPSSTNSIADPDEIPLPPHWVRKVDTKGRVYFCNLLTDETTWNLDQIDPQTGNLNTISTTQRSRGPTSNTNVANQENQPLSWNQLSTLIAHAIHGLKNSIKEGQTSLLRDDAIMVVHRIRLMLYVSNTVDKESSSHLKANKSLRVFHRALLASLAKTVLSTKAASGTWSQEDALHKLQMDVDQLLVDVGNFLSAARDLRLEIYDDKPRLLLPDLKTSMSSNGHRWRLASSNMDNINKPDPSTTLLVLADNIRGAMSSFMESVHSAFSSLNDQVSVPNKVKTTAPLLVAQFRNLSNTASQFLNAVDDLPFLPQQGRSTSKNNKSTPKGYPARQAIYNAMGLLFIASQTITNGELTISMIKMTYRRLEDCIYEIEKNVQTICQDVTTATATTTTKTTKTINHNKPSSSSSSTTRTTTRDITPPTPATPTTAHHNGSLLMGNDKPEYLCADYKQNEIIFNMEGNVKGGTVLALVQRLTQHDQLDSKFITTFLLTYRSFCTTEELFDALFSRYTLQAPAGLTEEELEIWSEKKLKLVRLRVFNVIKSWLDSYYLEEEDRGMLPTLLNFSETVIRESMQFGAEQLGKAIQKRMDAEDSSQLRKMTLNVRTTEMPPAILPKNMKRLRFLEIDPLELARQLTVMDSKLYSRIKPVECLDKNWGRADAQHTAANVKASIEYSNQVTAWVTDSILSKEELKKRSAVVKHWIYVAEKCRLLHNYNTCMAILSAFDNSSVGRLKRTWETMSARTTAILTGIRRLMGANRNFTEYRDIIHKVNPPCIPFLGIYLQDLTFIEDGNSNFLKKSNNLINFAKRMKTGEVIRELQQYQSTPYILQIVPDIQEFIKTHLQSSRDEETLYNLSLAVEPRERGEDTIARRLKESGL
ncbi:ras guanine nucleotide exchange factor domain-containing protein [Halteromyces radiatus]|uniref:ras guanine nucleotide exchange factor domain-containing protein n=1 Tax=Halteromyces radiatus TaxID=101107 RepID=UPI0022211415|nr:ras guanine nucleotide exchange factor domain-containing protein [Halteromyces radiatus]KAI8088828.1 ras guanine nucleotide exchange factor domain-containing protein [Halteromyces radiatus]